MHNKKEEDVVKKNIIRLVLYNKDIYYYLIILM